MDIWGNPQLILKQFNSKFELLDTLFLGISLGPAQLQFASFEYDSTSILVFLSEKRKSYFGLRVYVINLLVPNFISGKMTN